MYFGGEKYELFGRAFAEVREEKALGVSVNIDL